MSKNYPLVLGASGLTGVEVIHWLKRAQANIRVTYREQVELNTLRVYGVEPFYADYEQPDTISQAMVDIDRVIAILPIHSKLLEWGKLCIDSAKDRGVKHYVALSNFIVDNRTSATIARMHNELEEHLKKSGMSYTIIRSSIYFQNLLWATITIVRQKRFSLPMENAKIPQIDIRDVAEALVTTALEDKKHKNKIYTLTGGNAFSMFDAARLLSKKLNKTIRYYPTPLTAAEPSFRDMGLTQWISQAVAEMYKDYATLELSAVSNDFEEICGHPPRTLEAFIEENADIFAGKT